MGNQSCSVGSWGSLGDTGMGYQRQLMLHIAFENEKKAYIQKKQQNLLEHQRRNHIARVLQKQV